MTQLTGNTVKEQLDEIEYIKKARELSSKIADIKIAMLTTIEPDGGIDSRPMYTFKVEDDGLIWMFARKSSRKTTEIELNPKVVLNYSDPANDLYVTVKGTASITSDPLKIDELWNDRYKTWFPYGKEDPELCLLRVQPEKAEYWDTPDLLLAQIVSLVKNTIQGKANEEGEHKEIDF
ncbi:general stress protein 26 [Arcticibacter pallidicorallinus]|uniref:General stress protein 26 n=1 Tax=Arcticibacter pallidicorallinus TaxID=1259464 RepID=A0A2T0U589_9SPHI|nr:pyridoxamine 5'-phosphate oxidase family protein [Arcticibacter pallidicorallinus]PRY53095.1 general stress protein 26 [Arcticibacter pallidicorallinus]